MFEMEGEVVCWIASFIIRSDLYLCLGVTGIRIISFCIDPFIWKALKNNSTSISSNALIGDIYGGRKYQELKEFTQDNLTLVINTDGVQLFKSSSVSMWPIWVVINELPASMR